MEQNCDVSPFGLFPGQQQRQLCRALLTIEMTMTLGAIFPERTARSDTGDDEGAAAAGLAASPRRSDEASVRGEERKRILAMLTRARSTEMGGRREVRREETVSSLQGRLTRPGGVICCWCPTMLPQMHAVC